MAKLSKNLSAISRTGKRSWKGSQRSVSRSKNLLARAERVIPRAAQTLSKAPDQFVRGISPYAMEKGKGCKAWDVDGNEYIDLSSALGASILGYQHPAVEKAVRDQRKQGTVFGLPGAIEVELAERLVKMHPFIEMARFGMNGSDATTGAVRIARAYTGREHIAKCGYHGWADWTIATHPLRSGGIPQAVKALTHEFAYNDIASLEKIFDDYPGQIAAVTLEPTHGTPPKEGFLKEVIELAHKNGAIVVFDELVTGFRLAYGGAAEYFGVEPDLVCYGKAISNGEPLSVIAGRREIMQVLDTKDIFFSFTYAGYLPSIAASLATLDILKQKRFHRSLFARGELFMRRFNEIAAFNRAPILASGIGPLIMLKIGEGAGGHLPLKTLFFQETAKAGIFTNTSVMINDSHTEAILAAVLGCLDGVLRVVGGAARADTVESLLEGPMVRPRARPSA